jgi:hypothetical protein
LNPNAIPANIIRIGGFFKMEIEVFFLKYRIENNTTKAKENLNQTIVIESKSTKLNFRKTAKKPHKIEVNPA